MSRPDTAVGRAHDETGTGPAVPGDWRLLVLVDDASDRRLLVDRLAERFDVVAPDEPELVSEFDCCLVDEPTLPAVADDLARRREAIEPLYLPVLLLAEHRERGPGPWERNAAVIGPVVDGVLELPVGKRELDVLLGRLLRARSLSLEVVESRDRLEQYERIVETADDPIFAADDEGRYTLVNDAFVEAVGRSRESVLGQHFSEVIVDTARVDTDLERRLVGGETVQYLAHVDTDEGIREFQVRIAPLTTDGEFVGSVGVARDVTDVRERDRRLSVLDRVLRHNLRNKINIVLAHAQAIEDGAADPREHAAGIRDAAADLLNLSEEARRFRHSVVPEAGTVSPYDLAANVPDVVEEASVVHPDAEFAVEVPEAAVVDAHEAIELAVEELVENAVRHNDRDHPSVEVSVRRAGDGYELRVADDGPGIGDLTRRALTSGEETPMQHTTGLGLWLVQWTATSSGGRLEISERDPRGSVVTMWLPAADSSQ